IATLSPRQSWFSWMDPRAAVLVVDDCPEDLEAIEAALEPLEVPVVTAGSGREALRRLLERPFSTILLDVQLPDLDGLETAAYVRRRQKARSIPIVFLIDSSRNPEDMFRDDGAGAVDYVVKPIDPAMLRSKVAVFVE